MTLPFYTKYPICLLVLYPSSVVRYRLARADNPRFGLTERLKSTRFKTQVTRSLDIEYAPGSWAYRLFRDLDAVRGRLWKSVKWTVTATLVLRLEGHFAHPTLL
jgi:hypothetical protein